MSLEQGQRVRWRSGLSWAADIFVALPGFLILAAIAASFWRPFIAGNANLRPTIAMLGLSVLGGLWRLWSWHKRTEKDPKWSIHNRDGRMLFAIVALSAPVGWAIKGLPSGEMMNPLVALGGWLDPSEGRIIKLKVDNYRSSGNITRWWVHDLDRPNDEFEVSTRYFEGDSAGGGSAHWEAVWHSGFFGVAWMERASLRVVPEFGTLVFRDEEEKTHALEELRNKRIAIVSISEETVQRVPKFFANLKRIADKEHVVVLRTPKHAIRIPSAAVISRSGQQMFPLVVDFPYEVFKQAYPDLYMKEEFGPTAALYLFHGDGTPVDRRKGLYVDDESLPVAPLFSWASEP